MLASELIQSCLDLFENPTYLEIGVREGATLNAVRASRKIAVDPVFRFDYAEEQRRRPETEYHPVTSDVFFASYKGGDFDVVFLDGLHTSQQTLRDLMNTLTFTHSRSIVIIDDVCPDTYASSMPSRDDAIALKQYLGDMSPAWMGDVYKLVAFIESFLPSYNYATVADGARRLIMWREPRSRVADRTLAEVGQLDFMEFVRSIEILNSRSLSEIISAYRNAGTAVQSERTSITDRA